MKLKNIENCDYILCTGLFDDYEKDLKYYKNLFENNIKKDDLYKSRFNS